MKIVFVNPNSTDSMTRKVQATAQTLLPVDVIVEAVSNKKGPESIQGQADGDAAVPGMLEEIQAAIDSGANGIVIACFDDTGLDQARALSDVPVLGIGQAAYHQSMLMGLTFSVVTTLSISIPVLEENIQAFGVHPYCCRVRASEVPVLELEVEGSSAEQKISDEIALAIKEDGCQAIVLGCAGMTDLAERLSGVHNIPVIDGVAAASVLIHALALLRH
jgi:allantoin racemase